MRMLAKIGLKRVTAFLCRPEVFVVCIVLIPIAIAAIRAVNANVPPLGDYANAEIRSRDVFSLSHFPLLGSASSASNVFGVSINHPGPMWFIFASPFVWLFGGAAGLALSTATVNAMAVVGAAIVGFRLYGRNGTLATTLASSVLIWTLGSDIMTSAWNPYVLVLLFFLMLLLTVAVASGQEKLFPVLLLLSSFSIQTHLGYVFIATGLCLVATVTLGIRQWREHTNGELLPGWRKPWLVATALTLLCWTPPLWEQFFGEGNIGRLITNLGEDAPKLGMKIAFNVVAAVDVLPPWWSRSSFSNAIPFIFLRPDGELPPDSGLPGTALSVVSVIIFLGALMYMAFRASRRKDHLVRTIYLIGTLAVLLALVAASNSLALYNGLLSSNNLLWIWSIGAFIGFAFLTNVTRLPFFRNHARRLTPVLIAPTILFAVIAIPAHVHETHPGNTARCKDQGEILRDIQTQMNGVELPDKVLVDAFGEPFICPYYSATMAYLQRRNIEFTVPTSDPYMILQMGPARRSDGEELAELLIFVGRLAITKKQDVQNIALANPLTPAEEQALTSVERKLIDDVRQGKVKLTETTRQLAMEEKLSFSVIEFDDALSRATQFVVGGWAIRLFRADFLDLEADVQDSFAELDGLLRKIEGRAVTVQLRPR